MLSFIEHISLHLALYLFPQSIEVDHFLLVLLAIDASFEKNVEYLHYVFCVYLFKMLHNFLVPFQYL